MKARIGQGRSIHEDKIIWIILVVGITNTRPAAMLVGHRFTVDQLYETAIDALKPLECADVTENSVDGPCLLFCPIAGLFKTDQFAPVAVLSHGLSDDKSRFAGAALQYDRGSGSFHHPVKADVLIAGQTD